MTYNSRKNIVGMSAGVAVVAAYIIYICTGGSPASDDVAAWARIMIVFIGIGIISQIVIQILFHIAYAASIAVKERDMDGEKTKKMINSSMVEDERDKLIKYKSLSIGSYCTGGGLMIALFALAFGVSTVVALHIIIAASTASSLVEGCVGIFYHERGVRNG